MDIRMWFLYRRVKYLITVWWPKCQIMRKFIEHLLYSLCMLFFAWSSQDEFLVLVWHEVFFVCFFLFFCPIIKFSWFSFFLLLFLHNHQIFLGCLFVFVFIFIFILFFILCCFCPNIKFSNFKLTCFLFPFFFLLTK